MRRTRRGHVRVVVIRKQGTVNTLPFVLLALVDQTAFLAFQLPFLVFVEAFQGNLIFDLAATSVTLMLAQSRFIGECRAATVALDRQQMSAIKVFSEVMSAWG